MIGFSEMSVSAIIYLGVYDYSLSCESWEGRFLDYWDLFNIASINFRHFAYFFSMCVCLGKFEIGLRH